MRIKAYLFLLCLVSATLNGQNDSNLRNDINIFKISNIYLKAALDYFDTANIKCKSLYNSEIKRSNYKHDKKAFGFYISKYVDSMVRMRCFIDSECNYKEVTILLTSQNGFAKTLAVSLLNLKNLRTTVRICYNDAGEYTNDSDVVFPNIMSLFITYNYFSEENDLTDFISKNASFLHPIECGVNEDGCIVMFQYNGSHTTIEAFEGDAMEGIAYKFLNMKGNP